MADEKRMPLAQHLDELRACLFRALIGFVVLFFVGFALDDWLIEFIVWPWNLSRDTILAEGGPDPGTLIMIRPAEGFIFSMKVAGGFALMVGAPWYLKQVWNFVGAGLLPKEQAAIRMGFFPAIGLFALGLVFGFRYMLPLAFPILLTWVSPEVLEASVTVSEYFHTLMSLTLLMGAVFELPLLMWLLVRAGFVDAGTLASSRRGAVLGMLVFASIMTPPDVVTQLLVVGPMVVLYEAGLLLAKRAQLARERALL